MLALTASLFLSSCDQRAEADPRMVSEWMRLLYGAIRVERISPPVASRVLAYATTALYSGLASTDPEMLPLAGLLNGYPELPSPDPEHSYDGTLAAVTAERVLLDSLFAEALPTTRSAITRLADSLVDARIAAGVDEAVRMRSDALGREIGIALVAWARTDGFDSTRGRPYEPPVGVGLWFNDAPPNTWAAQNLSGGSEFVALDNPANLLRAGTASDRGLIVNRPKRRGLAMPPVDMTGTSEPYWGQVRPFVLTSWSDCPVPPPPSYSTDTGSVLYQNARAVHALSVQLKEDERTTAFYWADNAGESGTPPGHWISIASQMATHRRLSAAEAAELMVMTAVAQADAFIAAWGYKYKHNVLRPRTYIRANIDSTWEPLIPSPPFPEYPSGHSAQSAAAATVMTAILGDLPFDDSTSRGLGHAVRRFESFRAAAAEAGLSRVLGGIHFPAGNVAGRAVGECIGETVVRRLRPGSP